MQSPQPPLKYPQVVHIVESNTDTKKAIVELETIWSTRHQYLRLGWRRIALYAPGLCCEIVQRPTSIMPDDRLNDWGMKGHNKYELAPGILRLGSQQEYLKKKKDFPQILFWKSNRLDWLTAQALWIVLLPKCFSRHSQRRYWRPSRY